MLDCMLLHHIHLARPVVVVVAAAVGFLVRKESVQTCCRCKYDERVFERSCNNNSLMIPSFDSQGLRTSTVGGVYDPVFAPDYIDGYWKCWMSRGVME